MSRKGLCRHQRLRRRADYLRCYRGRSKRRGSLATLHFQRNDRSEPRLGITASRKLGKAVTRQKAKRRVREIFRCWPGRSDLAAFDIVVHLNPGAGSARFFELERELTRHLAALPTAKREARRAQI